MRDYRNECCQQISEHIQDHDRGHVGVLPFAHVAQRAHDKEKYEHGRDAAERPNEQITENGNSGCLRNNKAKDDTNDQADNDTFYKADAVPFFDCVFHTVFRR